MKRSSLLFLTSGLCLLWLAAPALGQDSSQADTDEADVQESEAAAPLLKYEDYTVKAYTLSAFGGSFSGATYLENQELWPRTVLEEGANDIRAYDGGILQVSRDFNHYDAAHKTIEPGNTYGGRVGIYIAEEFHLDLVGSYSQGTAVTTMLYTPDPEGEPEESERITVDEDDGFQVFMGGINLVYDAKSASFFNIVPRLGFGLGGVINRYSALEDMTAMYLQGLLGLEYEFVKNFRISAQADLSIFAYSVEELGYSNMVNYTNFTLGLSWFIDVVPPPARAAYEAEREG